MCTSRVFDRKTGLSFSCRKCDQCRNQAFNDLRGRLIAEHRIAQARGWPGYFVTLTYGSDDRYHGDHRKNPRALSFFWEDVAQWSKRLRRAGYRHRVYIVGEVGDDRGRVHWHLVIWFTGSVPVFLPERSPDGLPIRCLDVQRPTPKIPPNIKLSDDGHDRRYLHWLRVPADVDVFAKVQRHWQDTEGGLPLWTHGWSHWKMLTDERIAYAIGYIFKNGRINDTGVFGKGYQGRKWRGGTVRPPLGADYFSEILAPKYVAAGLTPTEFYKFHDVRQWKRKKDTSGEMVLGTDQRPGHYGEPVMTAREPTPVEPPFVFFLPPGPVRRIFFDAFVTLWRAKFERDHAHRRPDGGFKRSETDLWPQSDLLDAHVDDMVRRQRRADGVPDVPAEAFDDEFYLRRFEGVSDTAKALKVMEEQRARRRPFADAAAAIGSDYKLTDEQADAWREAIRARQGQHSTK